MDGELDPFAAPVMIDNTDERAATTHMLCCSCAMCLSAAASSVKAQGSMNLASNTAPVSATQCHRGCRHPTVDRMPHPFLNVGNGQTRRALVPGPVENVRALDKFLSLAMVMSGNAAEDAAIT
ncbi:hypothetical protein ACVWXO_005435 [Bradyrhizobium sp. LM2.7]